MYTNRRRVQTRVSDDSVMRDTATEMYDLCISVLRTGVSRMRFSQVVTLVLNNRDLWVAHLIRSKPSHLLPSVRKVSQYFRGNRNTRSNFSIQHAHDLFVCRVFYPNSSTLNQFKQNQALNLIKIQEPNSWLTSKQYIWSLLLNQGGTVLIWPCEFVILSSNIQRKIDFERKGVLGTVPDSL
jgi:hypothetical protein